MSLTANQETVANHVVRFLGPVHGIFELSQPHADGPSIAVLHVPATEHKPFQLLVTAGVSGKAMQLPDDLDPVPPDRIELMIGLPPAWPTENPGSSHAWPIRLLADLAHFPTDFGGWLGEGHTIPNGDPMKPYGPSTGTTCALIAPPLSVPPEARTVDLGQGQTAALLAVVPLFPREVELKLQDGVESLFKRLDEHRVTEVLDPSRRAVAGTLLDLLDGRGAGPSEGCSS